MTWGYDVQIEQALNSTSKASIFQHAGTLLNDLAMLRDKTTDQYKPIVFISHSLGGIVVKDALCQSKNEVEDSLKNILSKTRGVLFLGCPHRGSNIASLGKIAFEISRIILQNPNIKVLRGLEVNSEILERITKEFGQVLESDALQIHSFQEELDTKGVMIVDASSSIIGHPKETRGTLHANHRNMAKISSLNDVKFQRIVSIIQRWDRYTEHPSQAILQSLDFPEARVRLEMVEPAYKETYEWLFDPDIGFADWLEGKHTCPKFWIQGKPGSGKSTAMKYAMSHQKTRRLLQKYNRNEWVVAGYFFHDRGSGIQKSILGFLREILYQILRQQGRFSPIYGLLTTLFKTYPSLCGSGGFKKQQLVEHWDVGTIQEALLLSGRSSSSDVNICLFVDAMDEHDGNHRDLLSVLNRLAQLTENPCFRLRLCLAGRPENAFKDVLQSCPGLTIHLHTTRDVQIYAEGRIQNERGTRLTDEGENDLRTLIENIIRAAQGVFMWVRLVVDELIDCLMDGESLEELNHILLTIPTELEDLYERSLRRSNLTRRQALPKNKYEAYVMFQMAACCLQPFTLNEFIAATLFLTMDRSPTQNVETYSSDQMQRRLSARSAGLLEARPLPTENSDFQVQFIHQTVNEFMVNGRGSSLISEDIPNDLRQSGHLLIFRYLTHLLLCDPKVQAHRLLHEELFQHYACVLEHKENYCVRELFEPALLLKEEQNQEEFVRVRLLKITFSPISILDNNNIDLQLQYPRFHFLFFYARFGLLLSASQALALLKDDMDELSISMLVQCSLMLQWRDSGFQICSDSRLRIRKLKRAQDARNSSRTGLTSLIQKIREENWFGVHHTEFPSLSKASLIYYNHLQDEISNFAEKLSSNSPGFESEARLVDDRENMTSEADTHQDQITTRSLGKHSRSLVPPNRY